MSMQTFNAVAVGGGTGLYFSLRALKRLQEKFRGIKIQISAIVSVADDGGSTGRLRDEFGYLPPGDLRRALLALSHETGSLRKLFNYRFEKGEGLSGHNMGNLLLTALNDIYGDAYEAIRHAGRILHVRGRVIPVTLDDTRLCATLEDGTIIRGETNIDIPKHEPTLKIAELSLDPSPQLFAAAKKAIERANMIIIGPGDLYTSLLPDVLVEGFSSAVLQAKHRGAQVVFVTNTMTKNGETNGFKASDFLREIEQRLGKDVFTHVLCNTKRPPKELLRKYEEEKAEFVEPDLTEISANVLARPLLMDTHLVRHDPERLAKAYEELILSRPAIIFDLDDTLIDASGHLGPQAEILARKILKILDHDDAFCDRVLERRKKIGMIPTLREQGFDNEEIMAVMRAYTDITFNGPFMFEDSEILGELHARLFLVTRGIPSFQQEKININDLGHHFERILIAEPINRQSKSELIRKLIDEEKLVLSNTYVVGDNLHDEIAAAKELGAKAILIDRTGKYHDDELKDITAIKSLRELKNLMKEA